MKNNAKTVVSCPSCSGKMRVPVSDTALRVKCPFCNTQFRHEPDTIFAGRSRGFDPRAAAERMKARAKTAVSGFAAWPPGRKLFLYIAVLALVITVFSSRRPAGRTSAQTNYTQQYQGKPYLLEDPQFLALLEKKGLARVIRR